MTKSSRLLFLWVTAVAAGVAVGCVPKNRFAGQGQRARGTEAWSWRMQATEGKWTKDQASARIAAADGEPEAEAAADDLDIPAEKPAPKKAAKVAREKPAADDDEAEMSFAPVRLTKAEPKPQPKPVAKKPAPAPRPVAVARRAAPAPEPSASFEEDEYLDELLGETGGGKKKKAAAASAPVKTSEITMDEMDVGDPDARERERDLARARAAGEAAVARMKAKLAKQGFKPKDQGPVPDIVAKPKRKAVVVAQVEADEDDEAEGEADAEEEDEESSGDEDEVAELGEVVERTARKVEKRAAPVSKPKAVEKVVESKPAPASKPKKKTKGEFYASGEGFLAEDDTGSDDEASVEDDGEEEDGAAEDDGEEEEEARPAKKKSVKKPKKAKKKSSRAARSSKRKSRAASKGDRRKKRSGDDGDDA